MSSAFYRPVGHAVVSAGFLSIAFGLTMLFVVLDFFALDGSPGGDVVLYMQANLDRLNLALVATLVGYMLAVPVMLGVTVAAFGTQGTQPLRRHLALGLVWASLPLRPIWWAMLITLSPVLAGVADPATDAAQGTATLVTFQSLSAVFNTVTEDIAINILGGGWYVLVGLAIIGTGGLPRWLGGIGLVIGSFYLLSSAELFGLTLGEGGGLIPMVASISGPFWLAAAGFLSVRRVL